MPTSRQISWIHISDIHFRSSDQWRDSPTRDSLIECISTHIRYDFISRPDLVFCTGDVGFGESQKQGLAAQYDDAEVFLANLLSTVNLPTNRLFLVPGNHDVSRAAVNKNADAHYRLIAKDSRTYIDIIDAAVANNAKEYRDCMSRLELYRLFVKRFAPHLYSDQHVHYVQSVRVNDIDVQIIGLNSAWNCSGSEEERELWVGAKSQLAGVRRDESVRIALMHHPLEWVTKADASLLENRLGSDIHILLHGHEHEFREHSFAGGFPVIGTGAVSTAQQLEHGVLHARLDLATGLLHRTLFLYSSLKNDWIRSTACDQPIAIPFSGSRSLHSTRPSSTYANYFSRPGRLGMDGDIDDYSQFIEPGSYVHNRDGQYFFHLWSDSMGPHTIEKLAGDSEALHYDGAASSTRIVQKDNLDAYFLRKVVVTPAIAATASDDPQDVIDATVNFDAFTKEVSESPRGKSASTGPLMEDSENKVRYLIGDAGIGKTLAALKLIDYWRISPKDEFGYTIHSVYIDLHQDKNWALMEPMAAVNKVVERVVKNLSDCVAKLGHVPVATFVENAGSLALDDTARKLSFQLAQLQVSPIIVLDNGDRFFFDNARFRFFESFARRRDWYLDDTFVSLVDRFVNESLLGKIGASVLIVCRRYVYGHCLRLSDAADPSGPIRRDHKPYQLLPAGHDEIIDSRIRLLKEAAMAATEGKYRNAAMFQERIANLEMRISRLKRQRFHRDRSVLRTVWELGHQGHRSLLTFFGALPVDVGPGAEVADRLFGSSYLLLRLYISNLRKRYSQAQGHFPNLFLNDAFVLPNTAYPESRSPHIHTYWLKYQLLKWFQLQRRGKLIACATSEEAIHFFTSELNYEEDLVRLAVGSLADPSTSSCLKTLQPDRLLRHVELLQLTPRGEILISGNSNDPPLCLSFDYLQLVTDDYLLALPRCVASKIFVEADLGHSLKPGFAYAKGARDTLRKKIPAALTFYRVLVLSFELEAKHRGNVLKLQEFGAVPDFQSIENGLLDSIARLDMHFVDGDETEAMPNPREVWKRIVSNSEIASSLAAYYLRPPAVSRCQ